MYFNFIITDSKKYKISTNDILAKGQKCIHINNKLIENVTKILESTPSKGMNREEENYLVKLMVILNRLKKIASMINDCQSDKIIMTKFVDKFWNKYSFFSELGLLFVSADEIKQTFNYLEDHEILAVKDLVKEQRY